MLVLSRRKGEAIRIGDDVVITVVRIKHGDNSVGLGIEAPREVSVHRQEVYDAIHTEGRRLRFDK